MREAWHAVRGAVSHTGEQTARGTETSTSAGGERVQLREEELQARTQQVQTGEVGIRKEVVTEQQEIEVPVRREEVVIERHPVERRPAEGEIRDEGETVRVPVHEEQVTVEKQPVVREEIEVGTRQVQDTERVSGTVRREEARVERQGDTEASGEGTPSARREAGEGTRPDDRTAR